MNDQAVRSGLWPRVLDLYEDALRHASAAYWSNRRKLLRLRDKHRGERCFILGNGPSLNRTDLPALAGERTVGLNRIYLLFEKMGYVPSYFVCINPHVLEQSRDEILKIPCPKILGRAGASFFPPDDSIAFVRSLHQPRFSYDIPRGVWEGATVTYCAMQVAYYLGFTEVVLVGVDHHYSTTGPAHTAVVSEGDDPDHFDPNYFGKGVRWQLPDLATSERAYGMARQAFERAGRRVLDATVGGQLQVFPKVALEDVL